MNITDQQKKIISGIIILLGGIVGAYTNNYNQTHDSDPNTYGKWVAVVLILVGMVFMMPWKKK